MARLFSISFNYNERKYSAMVNITGADDNTKITVNIDDTSMHSILPDGKMSLNAEMKIINPAFGYSTDPLLIDTIVKELKKHEGNSPLRSLWY